MMSTTTTTATATLTHQQHLRNQLLSYINLQSRSSDEVKRNSPAAASATTTSLTQQIASTWTIEESRSRKTSAMRMLTTPLETIPLKDDPLSTAADDERGSKRQKTRRKIVFEETVQVVPIPMRTEYSARVRSRMWSNAMELHENAIRNTVEFAHEGYVENVENGIMMCQNHLYLTHTNTLFSFCFVSWNWRNATEDENMYVCVATGELIHPCHYTTVSDNE